MTDASPLTVSAYLEALRSALQGADPALVQDALYDAEEHLRAEIAQHPEEPEATVLERIVGSYGAPEEVADAYRANEVKVQAALRTPKPPPKRSALGRFFAVYTDPTAYLSLLYLLLSLVTGVLYFTFASCGISLSIGLVFLIIGVPFFLLFIGMTRVIALVEGRIIESLLGTRMPRRPLHPGPPASWLQRIGEMLRDPHTWGTLLYLLLMLPLGVFYFVVAVVGTVVPLALIVAPVASYFFDSGLVTIDGAHQVPPLGLLPLLAILGIVLLTATMHLARGLGYLHGQLAKSLLVRAARTED